MTKAPFSTYKPSTNGNRTIEEAISELQREMDTRKRIFDNWVLQGRCSWVDAHDRMERLLTALKLLIRYSNEIDQAATEGDNPTTSPHILLPESELDTAAEAVAA